MKRLMLLGVSVVALTWFTGCCHSCGNRCVDWNDGCYAEGCDECDSGVVSKLKHRRHRNRCRDNCCQVGYSDSCCGDSGMSGGQVLPGYDTSNLQGGGCAGCSGATSSYGGIPLDPSSGWTVVPNSTTSGSEPTPAPGASLTPIPTPASSIPSAPGSVPPPPVSYHTLK